MDDKKQVLLIDDDPAYIEIIKFCLEKAGFNVSVASDGQQAIDMALKEPFGLILMDVQMPNINGMEATRVLRENDIKIPIVVVTANAMKGDDEKCFQAGANDYLTKPVDIQKMMEVMKKYLSAETAAHHA